MKKIIFMILILGLLILSGCSSPANIESTTELTGEVKEFTMMAQQWEFVPDIIEVNKGDTVRLIITSMDVEHGFSISEFGVSVDLPVNEDVVVEFVASEAGNFEFGCSVYCGSGHLGMDGELIVN